MTEAPVQARASAAQRRRLLLATWCGTLVAAAGAARAQSAYPSRAIRLVVPFAPGGSADLAARALSEPLSKELGVPIVVDNRAGAAGVLGTQAVLRSPVDGYTLLFGNLNSQICAPLLMAKPPYDGVEDFVPLGMVMSLPGVVLTHAALPVTSFAEFVRYAQRQPGRLNFASAGIGSNNHLVVEMLKARTGIDLVHVPYRGTSDGQQALAQGDVALLIDSPLSARTWLQQGKVRALAVTSAGRSSVLPEVPSLVELGVLDQAAPFWIGVFAAAGLPPAMATRLREAIARAVAAPAFNEFAVKGGGEPGAFTAAQFAELLRRERRLWGDVIRKNNLRAE